MKPATLVAATLVLLAGCVLPPVPATGPTPAGQVAGAGCMQILDCYSSCVDDACFQSCHATGSPESQAKIDGLIDCSTSVCQNDPDCVASSCSAEIQVCQGDGGGGAVASSEIPPATTASGARQPHANEGLLDWMTGEWIGTNHQFTFYGDGRVRRASGIPLYTDSGPNAGQYACVSLVNDTGTVTQEGDQLIMRFEASESNHCGDKEQIEAITVVYRIDWYDNVYDNDENLQLILRDVACPEGQSMYCDDALQRR